MKPAAFAALALFLSAPAWADPGKDESGHGRDRYGESRGGYDDDRRRHGDYDDRDRRRGRHAVPNGHRPPPGMCRVWYRDRPAGHQPPPTDCRRAERQAERHGGRVIYGGRRH